ncbi:HNH endonuclease [Shewanella maritima]|uniref:HNH endonuclease n=1 Tax=Shewanella maritima TaxID=2520507 RepID=A0A411PGF6_9GAMM|nr:HNH endonuclease [Shewanella maritima]QBF82578.1 HNH endonuclease [Shewanella maritima]
MYSVSFKLAGRLRRSRYKTDKGAYKAIYNYLKANSTASAIFYTPEGIPEAFTELELVPYQPPAEKAVDFYQTRAWLQLREQAFVKYGNRCACCGASPSTGAIMHVDHIKPRSKYPELALELSNLQILCEQCNLGKSNISEVDWRQPQPGCAGEKS